MRTLIIVLFAATLAFPQTQPAPTIPSPTIAMQTQTLASPIDASRAARIGAAIDAILASDPSFARASVGIYAVRASDGTPIYAHNEQQLFIPASNNKLITTSTAMALLGPDYHSITTFESPAPIAANGILHGALTIVGRGDTNISGRVLPYDPRSKWSDHPLAEFEQVADQLVARGLKRVTGDIIGDDTWFAYERWGDSWGQDDLMWDYGAPVSALMLNDDTITYTFTPTRIGALAAITANPPSTFFRIDDRLLTSAAKSERHLGIDREPGSSDIEFWGNIEQDAQNVETQLSVEDPALFAASEFREMLIERGVKVDGAARAHHLDDSRLPLPPKKYGDPLTILPTTVPPRTVLASLQSAPLAMDVKITNKVSQNQHAEMLMRQIGRERSLYSGSAFGGSIWAGTGAVSAFLKSIGIGDDEFIYADGSGMSPHDLYTPHMMTQLLLYDRAQPWAPLFLDSLPLAGIDGTLEHRFVNTPTQGRVRAKTGTLGEVAALSGYATPLDGEDVVFSIFVNKYKIEGGAVHKLIDPVVRAIVETR